MLPGLRVECRQFVAKQRAQVGRQVSACLQLPQQTGRRVGVAHRHQCLGVVQLSARQVGVDQQSTLKGLGCGCVGLLGQQSSTTPGMKRSIAQA